LALRPLISTAASSYALAASSAVSKVPSHTLLLLCASQKCTHCNSELWLHHQFMFFTEN
jgi:hypothetical protein